MAVKPAPVYFRYIEGMRGLGALYVFLAHLASDTFSPSGPLAQFRAVALASCYPAYFMIAVFLVVSGYCLSYPIALAGRRIKLRKFARRRFFRLYPAYLAALLLSLPGFYLSDAIVAHYVPVLSHVLPVFVLHLLMLHNLTAKTSGYFNVAFWSIALEVQVYFVFALVMIPLWQRFGAGVQCLVAIVLGLIPHFLFHGFLDWTRPWQLGLFGMGVWAADITASGASKKIPWKTLAVIAAIVSFALNIHDEYKDTPILADEMTGLSAALFLVAASLHGREWLPARIFAWRPFEWLGTFSYSLYLVHGTVIDLTISLLTALGVGLVPWAASWAVAVPIAVLVSYAFFRVFEEPFVSSGLKRATAHALENPSEPLVVAIGS